MTALDQLRAFVHDYPSQWQARLVLSDAMEDAGDSIGANGQRWQALKKKRPLSDDSCIACFWDWSNQGRASYQLPKYIIVRIGNRLESHRRWPPEGAYWTNQPLTSGLQTHHYTVAAAELALAQALHSLGIVVQAGEIHV